MPSELPFMTYDMALYEGCNEKDPGGLYFCMCDGTAVKNVWPLCYTGHIYNSYKG